jgi:hypothetical protein
VSQIIRIFEKKDMSVLVIKLNEEGNATQLKKIIRNIFGENATLLSDEQYRDAKFLQLMEEERKSPTLSDSEAKKELKKRGIKI